MDNLSTYLSSAGFTAAVLVAAVVLYVSGRIKSRRELAMVSAVIVAAGIAVGMLRAGSNERAQSKVATLFRLDPGAKPLVFQAGGSKGTQTQNIEAIYQFSPEDFEAYRRKSLGPIGAVSFKYQLGGFNERTIDTFRLSEDAFAWNDLPRKYPGINGYFPERGHYSRQRTPDDNVMAGSYLCAFIPITLDVPAPAGGDDVIACNAVAESRPDGITIMAALYEHDHTLHIRIH